MNTSLYRPSFPLRSRYSKRFHEEFGTEHVQGEKPTNSAEPSSATSPSQSSGESVSAAPAPNGKRVFTKRREEQRRREEQERLRTNGAAERDEVPRDDVEESRHTTRVPSTSGPTLENGMGGGVDEELVKDLEELRQLEMEQENGKSSHLTEEPLVKEREQLSAEGPTTSPSSPSVTSSNSNNSGTEARDTVAGSESAAPASPPASCSTNGGESGPRGSTGTPNESENSSESSTSQGDSGLGGESTSSPCVYTFCDLCPHLRFTSFEQAEAHVMQTHRDHVPDYQRLRTVVQQLRARDVWEAVKRQKEEDGLFGRCGRRVLEEGRKKDPGPQRMLEAHRAREQLEAVVQQWHPTAKVYIFGSSVTFGIWDGLGDIDFTVVDEAQLRAGTWPPPERNAVRSITELLRRAGFSYVNLEPISHARVPIIKHHASFPIRLEPSVVRRWLRQEAGEENSVEDGGVGGSVVAEAGSAVGERSNTEVGPGLTSSADSALRDETTPLEQELMYGLESRLEAEDVIARSVRYVLNTPASWEDRLLLEASIREAVGPAAVQQIWWNRTRDLMNVTLDSTTNAIRAATCPLAVVSPTLRARIQPLHEDCRPELYSIDFDLSFRVFGIRNSQLLRRYFMQHPCARPGAMILKDWSKRSGVNNSVNGFLTSYAVAILWLYFLLQKGVVQFVDPVKDVPASLEGCPKNPLYVPMVDPRWTEEERTVYATQAGDLLVEFFHFYAVEFNWQAHVVSLNRPGITTKASLGWLQEDEYVYHAPAATTSSSGGGAGGEATTVTSHRRHTVRYNFCIEDPYEENLNLGRHMGLSKTLRVQSEFYRGLLSLLKEGERDSCVFPPNTNNVEEGEVQEEAESKVPPPPPRSLAQRVLYRLMAITIREVSHSRRVHAEGRGVAQPSPASAASSNDPSSPPSVSSEVETGEGLSAPASGPVTSDGWTGLPQDSLRAVMEKKAKTELKIALKVWNWQQLIHRLGYKIHQGNVFPRREVGLSRRPAAPAATASVTASLLPDPTAPASSSSCVGSPPGVVPTPHALEAMGRQEMSSEETEVTTSASNAASTPSTGEALRHLAARGLSEEMQIHVSEGFLRLTPEWVAWSEPWVATATATASSQQATTIATSSTDADTVPVRDDLVSPLDAKEEEPTSEPQNAAAGGVAGGGLPGAALHSTPRHLCPALVLRRRPLESLNRMGRRFSTFPASLLSANQRKTSRTTGLEFVVSPWGRTITAATSRAASAESLCEWTWLSAHRNRGRVPPPRKTFDIMRGGLFPHCCWFRMLIRRQ